MPTQKGGIKVVTSPATLMEKAEENKRMKKWWATDPQSDFRTNGGSEHSGTFWHFALFSHMVSHKQFSNSIRMKINKYLFLSFVFLLCQLKQGMVMLMYLFVCAYIVSWLSHKKCK